MSEERCYCFFGIKNYKCPMHYPHNQESPLEPDNGGLFEAGALWQLQKDQAELERLKAENERHRKEIERVDSFMVNLPFEKVFSIRDLLDINARYKDAIVEMMENAEDFSELILLKESIIQIARDALKDGEG